MIHQRVFCATSLKVSKEVSKQGVSFLDSFIRIVNKATVNMELKHSPSRMQNQHYEKKTGWFDCFCFGNVLLIL